MGGLVTRLWWGGDPDFIDHISGLSLRDIYEVQRTWAPIYAKAADCGIELFIRFFKVDPESKNFFKAIKNKTDEQIFESYQFRAHAINLMSSLNNAISNLHQPEVVVAMMDKLGVSHKRLQVTTEQFDTMKTVIVDFLIKDLKLSQPTTVESWSRFLKFIYTHIFAQLNED